MIRFILACAILSVYTSMTIAQPSNCCRNRCRSDAEASNNSSTTADKNEPWENWHESVECRANGGSNTTTASAPPANASMVCENGTANEGMHETEQYYTCCALQNIRINVAQMTATLVLGCFTLGFVMVLIIGILRSKQVRRLPFNAYLVFLFVPSLIFTATKIVAAPLIFNCFEDASHPDIFTFAFYWTSNVLLNGIIAHDIYALLRNSRKCLRTKPLPLSTIYKRVTVVYLIAALYATWETILNSNIIKLLPPYSFARNVTRWTTILIINLPPIFYMIYICIRVWKDNLLPLSGETRALAFYFLRIAIVFFVIWIPLIFLLDFYVGRWGYAISVVYNFNYFILAEEIISAALALTKPDVHLAVKRLLCNGRGYQQWKARRRRPLSERSNEQDIDEPAEGGRRAENATRVSAWEKPDNYGDNIARKVSCKNSNATSEIE